jgi:putative hydrolase of HD superfamily
MQVPAAERIAALAVSDALAARLRFVLELDALKQVFRRNYLADGSRREDSAEHSWHLAMLGLVLADHAGEPVDPARVAKMLLVHDIVEVDAGDVSVYDEVGRQGQAERELAAADRIFGLLPPAQRDDLRGAWNEFEHGTSAEARFARSVDRLAALLLNSASDGRAWREDGITADRVRARNAMIDEGAPELWDFAQRLIDDAVATGKLPE